MAGSNGATGHGRTIAFGTSSFVGSMHFIGGTEQTREPIEDSHLALTSGSERTYVPGDLIEPGQFDLRYQYDQSAGVFPPITGAAETITITEPLKTGEATAATLAGTGFFIRRKSADVEINATGVMEGEATIKWDGKTGPTYTAGSA